ncbi:unnamed protein product [Moneuplotes crassus]|uniref:Uncharacterized protein n=1 Tax=Euplotes crassus TaxID=5936 RepID=A0AAD1XBT1_EUPCR|nr:unnamed protein product [Moneuplotes crassus]
MCFNCLGMVNLEMYGGKSLGGFKRRGCQIWRGKEYFPEASQTLKMFGITDCRDLE